MSETVLAAELRFSFAAMSEAMCNCRVDQQALATAFLFAHLISVDAVCRNDAIKVILLPQLMRLSEAVSSAPFHRMDYRCVLAAC